MMARCDRFLRSTGSTTTTSGEASMAIRDVFGLAILASLLATPLSAVAQATPAPVDPALLAFAEKLQACTPATATQPHPLMRGFTIEHAIHGARDMRCAYIQTMPGGMRMVCAFDEASRDAFADELRQTATTGRMSGSSQAAAPGWASACEIETASGQRSPMAP
jgi:hypothetical protein